MEAMKRKIWKWFVLVITTAVIFSLSSCGGGGGGDSASLPSDATPGTIELNNDSVVTIDRFYLAPVDQVSWGPNILSGPLFSGQHTFIVDIFPGFYDAQIRATGEYSRYYGYLYDIPIAGGDIVPLYIDNSSFTGSLELRNNTVDATIIAVFVVPANASTWGVNQISSAIGPLDFVYLNDLHPGLYDVRVVWNVGADYIYYDINLNSLTLTTLNVD
jgi:hypothetical protein